MRAGLWLARIFFSGYSRVMLQAMHMITVQAPAPGLFEITDPVQTWLANSVIETGLLTLFCRHTSASLLIQENAAPAAKRDLERFFARLAPEATGYEHDDEGADDMPAHLRTALTHTSLSIPVSGRRMMLGNWQGIYLFEHRRSPPTRQVVLHLIGE